MNIFHLFSLVSLGVLTGCVTTQSTGSANLSHTGSTNPEYAVTTPTNPPEVRFSNDLDYPFVFARSEAQKLFQWALGIPQQGKYESSDAYTLRVRPYFQSVPLETFWLPLGNYKVSRYDATNQVLKLYNLTEGYRGVFEPNQTLDIRDMEFDNSEAFLHIVKNYPSVLSKAKAFDTGYTFFSFQGSYSASNAFGLEVEVLQFESGRVAMQVLNESLVKSRLFTLAIPVSGALEAEAMEERLRILIEVEPVYTPAVSPLIEGEYTPVVTADVHTPVDINQRQLVLKIKPLRIAVFDPRKQKSICSWSLQ